MSDEAAAEKQGAKRWLTIEAACRLLGVDQSTLRRWSDAGRINVFVTPGGHRRYAEDDLRALIASARAGRQSRQLSGPALATLSLTHYDPERLRWVQQQAWYDAFDPATLDELREEGRQLVELAMRYIAARDGRTPILDEATTLAGRYGARNAAFGVSLADSVAAFLFFRSTTVETVARFLEGEHLPAGRVTGILRLLNEFLDRALLAMIAAHQRATVEAQAAETISAGPDTRAVTSAPHPHRWLR